MNWLEIQTETTASNLPSEAQLQTWVDVALKEYGKESELVIRIVDADESTELNEQYRQKTGPTNILSFPFEAPEHIEIDLLGDLVVCAPVLEKEALEQQKTLHDHWAHIIIHGVLHLLGYDHIEEDEAHIMEEKEIQLLKELNITNPYIQETIA